MGRNYSFLLYGARASLAGLLKALAELADPPKSRPVALDLGDGHIVSMPVDDSADKNGRSLLLTGPKADLQLMTWLEIGMGTRPDPAEKFIQEHWAEDNLAHLPLGKFRHSVWIEINLSEKYYELSLSSPTSSGSAIFAFSPNLSNTIIRLMRESGGSFGIFDSEQDTFKVMPHSPEPAWGSLALSFEEEDLILYSDRNLDACVDMLLGKIKALPNAEIFLPHPLL